MYIALGPLAPTNSATASPIGDAEANHLIRSVGADLIREQTFEFENPQLRVLVPIFLEQYFANLPESRLAKIRYRLFHEPIFKRDWISSLPWKWRYLALQLGGDSPEIVRRNLFAKAPAIARFWILARIGGGPHFHKVFQIFGREPGMPKALSLLFQSFEQSLPLAGTQAPLVRGAFGERIQLDPTSAPFVGSMAVVFRAIIEGSNSASSDPSLSSGQRTEANQGIRRLALRTFKPEILDWVKEDEVILAKILANLNGASGHNGLSTRQRQEVEAWKSYFPVLRWLLSDIQEMVRIELDIPRTARAQLQARLSYQREILVRSNSSPDMRIQLRVPRLERAYDLITGRDAMESDVLVQEWLQGQSFSSLKETQPRLAQLAAEATAGVWMQEAFLGSGFVHGDLHQGNLKGRIVSERQIEVGILDYGMATQLSRREQSQLLALALAVQLGSPEQIAETLEKMSRAPVNLKEVVRSTWQNSLDATNWQTQDWGAFAILHGVRFSPSVSLMIRGMRTVQNLLRDAGSPWSLQETLVHVADAKLMTRRLAQVIATRVPLTSYLGLYSQMKEFRSRNQSSRENHFELLPANHNYAESQAGKSQTQSQLEPLAAKLASGTDAFRPPNARPRACARVWDLTNSSANEVLPPLGLPF